MNAPHPHPHPRAARARQVDGSYEGKVRNGMRRSLSMGCSADMLLSLGDDTSDTATPNDGRLSLEGAGA